MVANQPSADANEPAWVGEVLRFWFEELGAAQWFLKSAELDHEIRARFLALHERILTGDISGLTGPRTLLAAIVVLDQFSRNMFRDTPRAFSGDSLARRLARRAIAQGCDTGLTKEEGLFLYLPFEHSEDREDQALSVHLIGQLGHEEWTQYALAHQSIIDRFGRFPHRNAVLGRTSTADEIALLKDPMGSF